TQDFILAACIYDPSEQERLLRSLIDANLIRNIEQESSYVGDRFLLEQNGGSFGYHINRYAALFKHPGFAAEEEWRLISKPMNVSRMHFRPGGRQSLPIFDFRFAIVMRLRVNRKFGLTRFTLARVPSQSLPEKKCVSFWRS